MNWLTLAFAAVFPPVVALWIHAQVRGPLSAFFGSWLFATVTCAIVAAVSGAPYWASGFAISAAICIVAWWWWRRRKDARRALARGGYKARALLAKLLERAREAAQPRPIRHRVPQGAPA